MAFEMKHTGGPYGDCCSSYDVMLDREYTVEEFVKEVLKEKPGEWGGFSIVLDLRHIFKNNLDNCQYRYGKIIEKFEKQKSGKMIIEKVTAHGGWTAMDYYIQPKIN